MNTIDDIKTRLRHLEKERENLIHELNRLQKAESSNITYPQQHHNISMLKNNGNLSLSSSHKIKLFRNLFRGRDDVYARLWISKKTKRTGYSPVCKNEWVKGVCEKPMTKCSNCPNRELSPLSDEVIRSHLSGNHVVGIYPMLLDETCYFLAVDFDGEEWIDDVFAFKQTCCQEGVPVCIERSRSGNGAHAWIFFNEAISASIARQMGCFLITETMSNRHQLDMRSYDRLFPNQDTLTKSGFGNLIALPFQKEAMVRENTLFIDENCKPYVDQWDFLSNVSMLSITDMKKIIKETIRTGGVLGAHIRSEDEDDEKVPWMRLPSGKEKYKPVIKNLPDYIEVVIANRIYLKTDGLPSVLLNQVKRLSSFQNPEFYKRQNMRLSTALTLRIICCAEITDGYLALPRGCLDDLSFLMNEYRVEIRIRDERMTGKGVNFRFYGTLSPEQEKASHEILKYNTGILVAPSASGKTVIAAYAIAEMKRNTLILVHRKPLREQWRMRLASFLGIELNDIGQIGGGRDKGNGILDVAMIQSLQKKGIVDDRVAGYGFVIVDECHHISAVSFERVMMQVKARYVLGLTATPYRRDGHQPIIHMQCGPIRYKISQWDTGDHISQYIVIAKETGFLYDWKEDSNIHDLWSDLINNETRNKLMVNDIMSVIQENRFPIILTERREHLDLLADMLKGKIENLVVLHGGVKPDRRREMLEKLSRSPVGQNKAILATGAYIGEGFDDPRLDTLFITMPISFKGKVVQYAGRLHRKHPCKKDVRIYDYVDKDVPVLWKMYQKRLRTYKFMGYEIKPTYESTSNFSLQIINLGERQLIKY